MSTFEKIFLSTGVTPEAAAGQLADALGMELHRDVARRVYVGRPVAGDLARRVGGAVHTNGYADPNPTPDEVSLLDGYDTVYAIWSTDPEIQEVEAARPGPRTSCRSQPVASRNSRSSPAHRRPCGLVRLTRTPRLQQRR